MIVYPNAKINLGLRVLRKRTDGFHELETVFYPVPLSDILEIVPSREGRLSFKLYGMELAGNPMDNLCVRAARLLMEEYEIPPVEIYLHKRIPAGAGLGGGSADAAFTLRALNELFALGLNDETLATLAARLGSDTAFFIYNRPMLGGGRGEILSPVEIPSLQGYEIRVVTPPLFVSTADAFKGILPRERWEPSLFEPGAEMGLEQLLNLPVEEWRGRLVNDFERTVFAKYQQLADYKRELYEQGALYASMSGSGSALFGIWKKSEI